MHNLVSVLDGRKGRSASILESIIVGQCCRARMVSCVAWRFWCLARVRKIWTLPHFRTPIWRRIMCINILPSRDTSQKTFNDLSSPRSSGSNSRTHRMPAGSPSSPSESWLGFCYIAGIEIVLELLIKMPKQIWIRYPLLHPLQVWKTVGCFFTPHDPKILNCFARTTVHMPAFLFCHYIIYSCFVWPLLYSCISVWHDSPLRSPH